MPINAIEYSNRYKVICWVCPVCKLLTFGKATSYHEQVHGEQEIYYNPLPQLKKEDKTNANPIDK